MRVKQIWDKLRNLRNMEEERIALQQGYIILRKDCSAGECCFHISGAHAQWLTYLTIACHLKVSLCNWSLLCVTVEVTLGPGRGGGGGRVGRREGGREGEWEEGGEKLKQKRRNGLRIIGMLEKKNRITFKWGGRTSIQHFIPKEMLFCFSGKPVNEGIETEFFFPSSSKPGLAMWQQNLYSAPC